MSDGGAQLPGIGMLNRLLHAVSGDDAGPAQGSIWRALCAIHWRATVEVTNRDACPGSLSLRCVAVYCSQHLAWTQYGSRCIADPSALGC